MVISLADVTKQSTPHQMPFDKRRKALLYIH